MGVKLSITKVMGVIVETKEKAESKLESKKARIWDEESPVCTLENRTNCYDPFSLQKAFHPLGIFTKIFGLFPCYDFAFVKDLSDGQVRLIHVLDYCYSALIFLLLTGGAILCHVMKPKSLTFMERTGETNMDYYVKLALIYSTILVGVQSLFMFPMKWCDVLKFVQLFTNIDKILRFDGRMEERWFAKKVIIYLAGCFIFTFVSFMFLFVYEVDVPCFTDFLMGPIVTMALMALIIPTALAVFFLNAIRLRMEHFNRKIRTLLSPVLPSCGMCVSFQDYGKELDEVKLDKKPEQLADDLEKMRILHCEIRTLGMCMSCIFGNHLVRDFLYCLIGLILYTYFLIYFQRDAQHIWVIYAGQAIFIVLKIFVLVCYAQHISCQAKTLQGTLQRVSLRRLDDNGILQIQAFLAAIDNTASFSAAGYFVINKALMTSVLGAITTYFIILIQFKVNGGGFFQ